LNPSVTRCTCSLPATSRPSRSDSTRSRAGWRACRLTWTSIEPGPWARRSGSGNGWKWSRPRACPV